ncbi:MAG: type III polyketide synthase, partial [Candidatus Dadabacteria bacterium]
MFGETPDDRVARFTRWAVDLGARALERACGRARVVPRDLGALVVTTCTGYLCPGLSSYLAERCGLRPDAFLLDLAGMGCAAAAPALEAAAGWVRQARRPAAVVSAEIATATFEMGEDLSLIISNAVFADGASALVVGPDEGTLRWAGSARRHLPAYRDDVRFVHREGRLHNRISARLPRLVARAAKEVVDELLATAGLGPVEIRRWAVHP